MFSSWSISKQSGERQSMTRRPIARARNTKSAVRHEHGAQRGGRRWAAGTRTRNQNKADDGCAIGQRRHQLSRNPEARALRAQLKTPYRAEQLGTSREGAQ